MRAALCIGWIAAAFATLAPHVGAAFEFELSSLQPQQGGDGTAGFILAGIEHGTMTGSSVSVAGDVNGDGIDDLIIGAPRALDYAGQSYVVFGRDTAHSGTFPALFELSDLLAANGGDGSAGFVVNGMTMTGLQGDFSGDSVSAAGDFNGDGVDDLVIGAWGAHPGGHAYVIFGRAADQDGGFPPEIELASLLPANGGDGSAGFVFVPVGPGDDLGCAVSAAGDINRDGTDDLLIGASRSGSPGSQAYVVFGHGGDFPPVFPVARLLPDGGGDGTEGFALNAIGPDALGDSVSAAGDLNADGIDDLIVGAPLAGLGDDLYKGDVFVIYGRDTAQVGVFPPLLELSSLLVANGGDGSAGFVLHGIRDRNETGRGVSSARDMNGDGIDDFVIAAAGLASEDYVIFGRSSDDAFPAEIELSGLLSVNGGDGSSGFVLRGALYGPAVKGLGDVSGDGIDELIAGAAEASPDGRDMAGETYVIFGRSTGYPAELDAAAVVERGVGFVLNGIDPGDFSGAAVSAADIDGDGAEDLIIGAPDTYPDSDHPGEIYVVFGPFDDLDGDEILNHVDNCSLTANADQRDTDGDGFGSLCDADLNDDCFVNFLDLGELKSVFYTKDEDADFNGDGNVNFVDLGIMKAGFFLPPGPSGLTNACDEARHGLHRSAGGWR